VYARLLSFIFNKSFYLFAVGETTEKSKTKIESDGFVTWTPVGYVIWETSNGNTFEGSSGNVITFPNDDKRGGGGNVVKFPANGKWGDNRNVNEGRKLMVGKACKKN
jgi:hypothetical protein